jgi:hypothetical protein
MKGNKHTLTPVVLHAYFGALNRGYLKTRA